MSLPVGDWQFWVATVLAVAAAWYVLQHLLPFPGKRRKRQRRRVSLTIGGRAPRK